MNKQTIEEAAKEYAKDIFNPLTTAKAFYDGAKWQLGQRAQYEWVNVKTTPARRDIEIWIYDDDGDVCTIDPEYSDDSIYECVLYWMPFFRPTPPKD